MSNCISIWLFELIQKWVFLRIIIGALDIFCSLLESNFRLKALCCWVKPRSICLELSRVFVFSQVHIKGQLISVVTISMFKHDCRCVTLIFKVNNCWHVGALSWLTSFKDLLEFRFCGKQLPTSVFSGTKFYVPVVCTTLNKIIICVKNCNFTVWKIFFLELLTLQNCCCEFPRPFILIIVVKRWRIRVSALSFCWTKYIGLT